MVDRDEDDLFKHTSMTFGEHLEELRGSLFKAVAAIAIGFCIGLWFGKDVVRLIQVPLENALWESEANDAVEMYLERVPPELRDPEMIKDLVFRQGLKPEEVFVAPREVIAALQAKYPRDAKGLALHSPAANEQTKPVEDSGAAKPKLSKEDMIRMFVWRPMTDNERIRVENVAFQEGFTNYIKVSLISGIIFASPFAFYFLWSFVAAGLYPHEKRYVHLFMPVSIALFLCGAVLAFIFVFPPVLGFFINMSKSLNQDIRPRISEWFSFVLMLPICFGISFQLPLVMLFLERIRIFNVEMYLSKWRIAVLVMAGLSMVLSPGGDPISMMMMLVPLVGLYFGGILLCKWLPTPGTPALAQSDAKAYATTD